MKMTPVEKKTILYYFNIKTFLKKPFFEKRNEFSRKTLCQNRSEEELRPHCWVWVGL